MKVTMDQFLIAIRQGEPGPALGRVGLLSVWLMLFGSLFGHAEKVKEGSNRPRSVEELEKILDQADQQIIVQRLPGFAMVAHQRSILSDWSIPELDALMDFWANHEETHGRLHVWQEALIEQHAFVDETIPCENLLGLNAELFHLVKASRNRLEGSRAESLLGDYAARLEAIIKGWSRRDPKAAWTAVKGEGGRLFNSPLIPLYGYRLPRAIFEHLARVDPSYAKSELLRFSDIPQDEPMAGGMAPGLSNVLYQGSMLRGMARGLPNGYDWEKLILDVAKIPKSERWEIQQALRGRVLARWMQDDAEAAVTWFRSQAGEVISLEKVSVYSDQGEVMATKMEPVSLRFAFRHWLSNDWAGAARWLRDRPGMVRQILEKAAWFDPDRVTKADLRRLLVAVQPLTVREDFLLKLANENDLRLLLSEVPARPEPSGKGDWERSKREIAELKVSEEIARRLLKAWQKEPVDDDPFGD